jgi:hypothetical protein
VLDLTLVSNFCVPVLTVYFIWPTAACSQRYSAVTPNCVKVKFTALHSYHCNSSAPAAAYAAVYAISLQDRAD